MTTFIHIEATTATKKRLKIIIMSKVNVKKGTEQSIKEIVESCGGKILNGTQYELNGRVCFYKMIATYRSGVDGIAFDWAVSASPIK